MADFRSSRHRSDYFHSLYRNCSDDELMTRAQLGRSDEENWKRLAKELSKRLDSALDREAKKIKEFDELEERVIETENEES